MSFQSDRPPTDEPKSLLMTKFEEDGLMMMISRNVGMKNGERDREREIGNSYEVRKKKSERGRERQMDGEYLDLFPISSSVHPHFRNVHFG